MKWLELAKKLAVLGRIYSLNLISEDEYIATKRKMMFSYNVTGF